MAIKNEECTSLKNASRKVVKFAKLQSLIVFLALLCDFA